MQTLRSPQDPPFSFDQSLLFQKLREFLFMLHPKVDQAVHKLCFPPRLLRDFKAAKRRQLHIDVANSSRPAANPAQQLQQLLLVSIPRREQQVKERFLDGGWWSKIVNGLAVRVFRESHQISLHPAKNKFAAMRYQSHRKQVLQEGEAIERRRKAATILTPL